MAKKKSVAERLNGYIKRIAVLADDFEKNGRTDKNERWHREAKKIGDKLKRSGIQVPSPPRLPSKTINGKTKEALLEEYARRSLDIAERLAAGKDAKRLIANQEKAERSLIDDHRVANVPAAVAAQFVDVDRAVSSYDGMKSRLKESQDTNETTALKRQIAEIERSFSANGLIPSERVRTVQMGNAVFPYVNREAVNREKWSGKKRSFNVTQPDGSLVEVEGIVKGGFAVRSVRDRSGTRKTNKRHIITHLATGVDVWEGLDRVEEVDGFDVGGFTFDHAKALADELNGLTDPLGRPIVGQEHVFREKLIDMSAQISAHSVVPKHTDAGRQLHATATGMIVALEKNPRAQTPQVLISSDDVSAAERPFAQFFDRIDQTVANTPNALAIAYGDAMRSAAEIYDDVYLKGVATRNGRFVLEPGYLLAKEAQIVDRFLAQPADPFEQVWRSWSATLDDIAEDTRRYYDRDQRAKDTMFVIDALLSIDDNDFSIGRYGAVFEALEITKNAKLLDDARIKKALQRELAIIRANAGRFDDDALDAFEDIEKELGTIPKAGAQFARTRTEEAVIDALKGLWPTDDAIALGNRLGAGGVAPIVFNPNQLNEFGELVERRDVALQSGQGYAGRFHMMSVQDRQKLADIVVRNVVGRRTREEAIRELATQTDRSRKQAKALFHSATIEFSRTVNKSKADTLNLQWFRYWGPRDSVTRPFCRRFEGKVLHRNEIDRLDNGQTGRGSVFVSGGGYNCRHHWRGVEPSWYSKQQWDAMRSGLSSVLPKGDREPPPLDSENPR